MLKAEIEPLEAYQDVKWSSSDNDIASIDNNGLLTAHRAGIIVITVESAVNSNIKVDTSVLIDIMPIEVEISDSVIELTEVGQEHQLVANTLPLEAWQYLNWFSSDESTVSVDDTGKIKAISGGSATIKAITTIDSDILASCEVTVDIAVESIRLNKTELILTEVDQEEQLVVTILPAEADQNVTWSSSDDTIIEVSDLGVVSVKNTGIATVTAKSLNDESKLVTCDISVEISSISIELNEIDKIVLNSKNQKYQLTANVLPAQEMQTVYWQYTNSTVISVDANGVITAKANGTSTVTVFSSINPDISKSIDVEVDIKIPVMTGLISYIDFDEERAPYKDLISGENVLDLNINTQSSSDTIIGGGNSVQLDGNSLLKFQREGSLTSYSVNVWVKTVDEEYSIIGDGSGVHTTAVNVTDNILSPYSIDNFYQNLSSYLNNGNWNMLTVVQDNTNNLYTYYVNGVKMEYVTDYSNDHFNNPEVILIGNSLNGKLDNLRLYNRVLNSQEIADLYALKE